MSVDRRTLHVSVIAIPGVVLSTLSGIHDALNVFDMAPELDEVASGSLPFRAEVVGETTAVVPSASGIPITPQRHIGELETSDIVIVPSLLLDADSWRCNRFPALVNWLARMHAQGATLCSACTGIFLLAETGLYDGKPSTIHWNYEVTFHSIFPRVPLSPERALVVSGERGRLISSGASASWHDLVLYLICRHAGMVAAQNVARCFAFQWHSNGLTPYMLFDAPHGHGDAVIEAAQQWLVTHAFVATPVEEMVKRSGIAARTFKRRFTHATGHSPIAYVQQLRIEEAKRRLERTRDSVDEIGWRVGYEDSAFFRRLFKRITGVTPSVYRRLFHFPGIDDSQAGFAGHLASSHDASGAKSIIRDVALSP